MTKADIASKIQEQLAITRKEASELMESVFTIMKDILESGETLKVSGFGNFEVKQKANRRGRNPQTGEAITIEARKVLTFKPSTLLKHAIAKATSTAEAPANVILAPVPTVKTKALVPVVRKKAAIPAKTK